MTVQKLRHVLVSALLLMSCSYAIAQRLQATRAHYSTANGLSSNAISDIVQDDWGYIWIATWNGLSRFDGYDFYNYKTGAGSHIPYLHNRIYGLTIDTQQNVWMHMYDNRVFVMKRNLDRIINPFEGVDGYEEFRLTCPITVASNGDVLISVEGRGIFRLRNQKGDFSIQQITANGFTITSMAEGYNGDIWLGTDQGIHLLDMSNMSVASNGEFLNEYINCLYSDGYNIYAGTQSGNIVTFAYGASPKVIRQGQKPINALFCDSHGIIWFSDTNEGAFRIMPETGDEKHVSQYLPVPDYDGRGGFFCESGGILWVGMNHGGYGYYNRETDEVEYFHNDPSNPWNLLNTVNASLELEEGVVFESTSRRGLEKLEIMKKTIERTLLVPQAESTLENETRALFFDAERKQLLIGNKASTLFFFNANGELEKTITHDSNGTPLSRIYGISKDSKGNYWLASKDRGLFRMTPTANGNFQIDNLKHEDGNPNTLSSNKAYSTVEDPQGNIWVATYGGGVNVYTHDKNGQQVFLHSQNGMISYPRHSHMKVRCISTDNDGNVWAGTTDGILIMSVKDGDVKIQRMEESEEYPDSIMLSNDIVCMARDAKGTMWVGTNGGGISCTTGKDSEGRWLFRTIGASEGLPSEEIKSITFDDKGNVWLATDNLICSFNPEKDILTTFTSIDGIDETVCSEGAATTLDNGNVLIGTINGYYTIDRKKLTNAHSSALKLRITDFWLNDVLQSPRLTDDFDYYVPDSREVTLKSRAALIEFRYASLNYQLQHRVHYQYMMEGYDKNWINSDETRRASYTDLPPGKYTFKVKAFLQESPEQADLKEIVVIVPSEGLFQGTSLWIIILLALCLILGLLYWWRKKNQKNTYDDDDLYIDDDPKRGFQSWFRRGRRKKGKAPKVNNTDDYYEVLD